jgi:hypothetical protein
MSEGLPPSEPVDGSSYSGGCHCGDVSFRVRAPLAAVLQCNCSICTKKGFLHLIVDREAFELLTPKAHITTYTFGTHTAQHQFCARCGIASFYIPRSHPDGVSVNARCLDDVDVQSLPVEPFDGRHWEENVARINPELGST